MGVIKTGHRRRGSGLGSEQQIPLERALSLGRHRGKVWYVDSNADSGGNGDSWEGAFQTLVLAVAAAAADDVIYVAPLHVETITAAAGLVVDVAGLTILGFGNGNRRPQINFTTVVGADMDVTAAGVTIQNVRFTGGFDALTGPVNLAAADISLLDIITEDVTGQAIDFIVTTDDCDRLLISGWVHRGAAAAGADTAISVVGGDDWVIEDFNLYGNFAVAAIENVTTAANRARIGGGTGPNYIWTEAGADCAITMVAASTGFLGPNLFLMLQDNAANFAAATVGAAMQFMKPIQIVNLAGESSADTTVTPSTNA